MEYKVKGTDILYNGHIYAEGQTIDLNEKDAKTISEYLELIPKETNPPRVVSKSQKTPTHTPQKTSVTGTTDTTAIDKETK